MARPSKPVSAKTAHDTKAEQAARIARETELKGDTDKIEPSEALNESQMAMFDFIVSQLEGAATLGNLDVPLLTQAACVFDRMNQYETMLRDDPSLMLDSKFMANQDRAAKQSFRYFNELGMSPQARAKMAIATVKDSGAAPKTIMDVLADDE